MNIDVYNTHIELYPYTLGDYPLIEKWYTGIDKFSNAEFPCGYLIEDNKLYLPRGTSISHLESMTGGVVKFVKNVDSHERMNTKFYANVEPRNELQKDSIKFLLSHHQQLGLNLQTGFGKQEPISRLIPVPEGGTKRMGDLQIGDKIFGSDGKPTTVIGVYPQGKKEVYEITFSDGRKARCGLEHLWEVYIDDSDKPCVMRLKDIISNNKTYRIQTLSNPVQYENKDVLIDPFIMGFNINKHIPEEYLYNSLDIRMKLLKGLIHGNGKVINENKMLYVSKSSILLNQINELVLGLGLFSNINKNVLRIEIPKERYLKIEDIKYVGKEESQCIAVDAINKLYLTEDFIVTHNTYCVANAVTEMNEKTLIITPNESIKIQWLNTFVNMFDYRSKHIMNISGSNVIDGIMNDEISIKDRNIFLVNHQTLHSYLFNNNSYLFHKFFKKLKIGIKVYDESHLNFANILLIDFFSNTKKTIYLTATFDRSDKTESACFKRAFSSVIGYGEEESLKITEKHILYHVVNINSNIEYKNRARIMAFPGYTAIKAGRYAFFDDPKDTTYNTIKSILNLVSNVEGKILIFVPLIEAADKVVDKLKLDFPDKKIMPYHSKMDKSEKSEIDKYNIIVSTIKSTGTGMDIPGLRVVINTENFASTVLAQQVIGRLRPYAKDKETFFFDIVDICIPNNNYYFKARFKKISTLVKKVIYLDINK